MHALKNDAQVYYYAFKRRFIQKQICKNFVCGDIYSINGKKLPHFLVCFHMQLLRKAKHFGALHKKLYIEG